jgi:RNA polymerase sigma-70 factor (ECF subfamily)
MSDAPQTRPSLLIRLRDGRDAAAWGAFVALYAPLVYGYARRQGLQDADAADLTQDVMQNVSAAVGRLEYDPQRGSFRGWLRTLAHRRLCDFWERQRRAPAGSGDTAVQQQLEAQPVIESEDRWEREFEQHLFSWAADQVRREVADTTWQAFWQTAVEGKPAGEVGEALGLSIGAVYTARSRAQARIKALIEEARQE